MIEQIVANRIFNRVHPSAELSNQLNIMPLQSVGKLLRCRVEIARIIVIGSLVFANHIRIFSRRVLIIVPWQINYALFIIYRIAILRRHATYFKEKFHSLWNSFKNL